MSFLNLDIILFLQFFFYAFVPHQVKINLCVRVCVDICIYLQYTEYVSVQRLHLLAGRFGELKKKKSNSDL